MTTEPIIQFAQDAFGSDAGQPADLAGRTPVPAWVTEATIESTILADEDHAIRIEDDVAVVPDPLADRTIPDALAYYLPFHFYRNSWGIYVRAAGVCALAEHLGSRVGGHAALDFSYRLLLEHERLHFFAEYAASRIEVVTHESCYHDYFKGKEAACHEEALANAHSIRSARRSAAKLLVDAAEAWMLKQPEGYHDFEKWLPPHFEKGRRQAACYMAPVKAMTNILSTNSHPAEFIFFQITPRRCPVRIVLDANLPWLTVAKPFPKQFGLQVHVRTNDHKPPHIHIDCPPGTEYTRYLWPSLTPYPNDARLKTSDEKGLRKYVAAHGTAIARKIAAVPWQ